jgi:hypothetical protein
LLDAQPVNLYLLKILLQTLFWRILSRYLRIFVENHVAIILCGYNPNYGGHPKFGTIMENFPIKVGDVGVDPKLDKKKQPITTSQVFFKIKKRKHRSLEIWNGFGTNLEPPNK